MRRTTTLFAAAILLPCGASALCVFALVRQAAGQSAHTNVNLNGNMNRAAGPAPTRETSATNFNSNPGPVARPADTPRPPRPPAPPAVRWSPVSTTPGYAAVSPLKLRAGAGALAPVAEELSVDEETAVELLEMRGAFVRVRVQAGGGEGRRPRRVEGWAELGEVMPHTTALVLDARSGEVLRRLTLGSGITSVTFSPDGKRALYHGRWASALYEADAADLIPTRRLEAEMEGSFGPASYTGTGHDLLAPFWGMRSGPGGGALPPHVVRADGGGNVTAAPVPPAPSGAEPTYLAFAPDGRTGFAFYRYPYGDEEKLPVEEDRGSVATAEVFDTATMQTVRRFKLPDPELVFEDGLLALNGDGSELYLLTTTAPQRLVVVETHAGRLVREVSLSGQSAPSATFARGAFSGGAPLIRYLEETDADHGTYRAARLDGGRLVVAEAGIAYTAEAGTACYAVDGTGTQLFTLDADLRPRTTRELKRPGGGHVPVGLFATPDGSRLVLLLSLPEDGC